MQKYKGKVISYDRRFICKYSKFYDLCRSNHTDFIGKKNKTEKLTQKLEELYLLVEKARIQLFDRLEILRNNPTKMIDEIDINTLHGLDSIDKAYMYIKKHICILICTFLCYYKQVIDY